MPWLLPVLLLLLPCAGAAQTTRPDSVARFILTDSSSAVSAQDTAHRTAPGEKSPGLAMLLSAVLPGAGQAYNESYWKVPVVLGLGVYFVSEWLDNNRRTTDYREKYALSLQASGGDERFLRLREFYKDQRDAFAWYFLILYVINIADAYVDASLSGFDVGPTLGHRGIPAAGLALRFTW